MELRLDIVELLDVFSLLSWGATSLANRKICTRLLRIRFRQLLLSITDDPDSLANAMRSHNVVISGSQALQFFLGATEWKPTDIDFYIPDTQFESFLQHLIHAHSASVTLAYNPHYRTCGGIKRVMRLSTPYGSIDCVRSQSNCALVPITRFWTTVLMNWVGPDSCGCAYPSLTKQRRGLIAARGFGPSEEQALQKYLSRNFAFASSANTWLPVCTSDPCMRDRFLCMSQPRFFGDSGSLVAHYDPFDVPRSAVPFCGANVVWRLTDNACPGLCHVTALLRRRMLYYTALLLF